MLDVATDYIVEIREAVKWFATPEGGVVRALDNIDLQVANNEFITLLGPSGCGKTTLLRCISGFEDLNAGEILVGGRSMRSVPPHRRPVNTVFQNYALFPHMTVGANVGYSLEVAGVARKEREKRVHEALELVNLTGLERRKPSLLSGGQQQRVALARAIVSRPKLLLLDEPLSALDRNLREAMQLELKTLQSELGISFVFVTHDQTEALTMSDRIVVLDGGKIQQVGSPTEIYDHPCNDFVAGFIGDSNLFTGKVTEVGSQHSRVRADQGPDLLVRTTDLAVGDRVQVMLRPEHLRIRADNEEKSLSGSIRVRLRQTIFVGADYHLLVDLPNTMPIKVLLRDVDRNHATQLNSGDEIVLSYNIDMPHVISGG